MTAAAIAHGTVPFPVGEVHSSDFTALDAVLGEEFQGTKGRVYRLVKSTAAVASPATLCFKRTTNGGDAVSLTDGTANNCCGVAVSDQVALAAGDYFFLQVDGEMTLTGKSGHGILAGDYLMPSAASDDGKVEQSTTAGADFQDGLPLRCHTKAGNVISAYPQRKLWGL